VKARTVERSLKGGLLMGSKRQNNQLELAFGEAVRGDAANGPARGTEDPMARPAAAGSAALAGGVGGLMAAVVARGNLKEALRQVKRNKGAPRVKPVG
jgi:RNA-directed DNA polymerase